MTLVTEADEQSTIDAVRDARKALFNALIKEFGSDGVVDKTEIEILAKFGFTVDKESINAALIDAGDEVSNYDFYGSLMGTGNNFDEEDYGAKFKDAVTRYGYTGDTSFIQTMEEAAAAT